MAFRLMDVAAVFAGAYQGASIRRNAHRVHPQHYMHRMHHEPPGGHHRTPDGSSPPLATTAMPHPRHGRVAWSDSAGDTLLRTFPPAWLGLGRLYPPGGAAGLVRQRDLGDI